MSSGSDGRATSVIRPRPVIENPLLSTLLMSAAIPVVFDHSSTTAAVTTNVIVVDEPDSSTTPTPSGSNTVLRAALSAPTTTTSVITAKLPSAKRKGVPTGESLTAPKLSRHNDAAYYPNIQCILCQEWVCSRNRYMHIESHLQYRPYACSDCGYDNRKEIFINLHIKKVHGGRASVKYSPDTELEHRAWTVAEQCLQHTRQILANDSGNGTSKESTEVVANAGTSDEAATASRTPTPPDIVAHATTLDVALLEPYTHVYRAKIHNSQRIEKSSLIEASRQQGHVPDFRELAAHEVVCAVCGTRVLGHHALLDEHVRGHLSRPAYQCNIDGCRTKHASKNFLTRHMKEVHKYRRAPLDLLEGDAELAAEFRGKERAAFPTMGNGEGGRANVIKPTNRSRSIVTAQRSTPTTTPALPPPSVLKPTPVKTETIGDATAVNLVQPDLLQQLLTHMTQQALMSQQSEVENAQLLARLLLATQYATDVTPPSPPSMLSAANLAMPMLGSPYSVAENTKPSMIPATVNVPPTIAHTYAQ